MASPSFCGGVTFRFASCRGFQKSCSSVRHHAGASVFLRSLLYIKKDRIKIIRIKDSRRSRGREDVENLRFSPVLRQSSQLFPGFPGFPVCGFRPLVLPVLLLDKNWKCERGKIVYFRPVDAGGRTFIAREKFSTELRKTFRRGTAVFPPSGVKFSVQEKWISFLGDSGDIFFDHVLGAAHASL